MSSYETDESEHLDLLENEDGIYHSRRSGTTKKSVHPTSRVLLVLTSALFLACVAAITAFAITKVQLDEAVNVKNSESLWKRPVTSQSPLEHYIKTAVAPDSDFCAIIGNYIMTVKHGSAVDGAISTMLCNGMSNMHSTGIGGGSFMLIYNSTTGKATGIDYRETAPAAATRDMLKKNGSTTVLGGKVIGIPGEIRGYHEAWKQFGRLPWSELFQPVIELCQKGMVISKTLGGVIQLQEQKIRNDPGLRELLINPTTNRTYKEGEVLKNPKLGVTYQTIAADPFAFYNGTLAATIASEIQGAGGIITAKDLQDYKAEWRIPVNVSLPNSKMVMYGMPPPASGVVLGFILGILDGYKMDKSTKEDLQSFGLYHHRLIESFKYAYAKRSALGDLAFNNDSVRQLAQKLVDLKYIDETRGKIDDSRTYNVAHYGPSFDWKQDYGTSHMSLMSPDGDAVAVTSTINTVFASGVRGIQTGIIYNNEMDDFSTPNTTNFFGIQSSPTNYIVPGKRPMSSMCPAIITDDQGNVKLIVGASGGSRITTASAYIASRVLFLKDDIKQATDYPRVHHQLVPNIVQLEEYFPEQIKDILRKKGHKLGSNGLSVAQTVHKRGGFLYAHSDRRKGGKPSGQ